MKHLFLDTSALMHAYNELEKQIEEEGNYTVYVKIVDKNDQITYINSERLVIDLNEPVVKISMNDAVKDYHIVDETGRYCKELDSAI